MGARLYNTEKLVEKLLTTYPNTRDSDALLYLVVCKAIRPELAKLPLERVLLERDTLGLPKYASVERARRKIQANNPELKGTEKVTEGRYEEWKEYREYALS